MKQVIEKDIIVKFHRVTEVEPIEGTDFAFYTDTREMESDGVKRAETSKGITSMDNIRSVQSMDKIDNEVIVDGMYKRRAIVAAISKENFQKAKDGLADVAEVVEYPYVSGYELPKEYVLVLWNKVSHQIRDLQYQLIPFGGIYE